MAMIGFSERAEHKWFVARWAYRQILEDVISNYPNDHELLELLGREIETDGLLTKFIEHDLAIRIAKAVQEVAVGTLSGTIRSGLHDKIPADDFRQNEYRKALQELLEAIPSPQEVRTA